MTDKEFRNVARINELRADALRTPPPLGVVMLHSLAQHQVHSPPLATMPRWASLVASRRDHFEDTVFLSIPAPEHMLFWKFLFAQIQPLYIALAPLW